ncbi:DUF6286 domain-containing protein [Amycolatopsis aidingensis]|uniref:DUF6286 domain-containing protein n=1 Tax=Amycolatopsis aidingensis TaxID=2842453 RepID=UPI0038CC0391
MAAPCTAFAGTTPPLPWERALPRSPAWYWCRLRPHPAGRDRAPAGRVGRGADCRHRRVPVRNAPLTASRGGIGRGVSGVRVRLRRGRLSAIVRTDRTVPTGLNESVRAALERRLDQIAPATCPRISVRVRARRSSP